jgi:tetratricopeptide (TPR) repeat protein
MRRKDLEKAEIDFRMLSRVEPAAPDAPAGRARALLGLGRYTEALNAALSASRLQQGPANELLAAKAKLGLKRYDEALPFLERAAGGLEPAGPLLSEVKFLSALALRAMGRTVAALSMAREASNSGAPGARFLVLEICLDAGSAEDARSYLSGPGGTDSDAKRRWIAARLHLLEGRVREALGLLQGLEKTPPVDPAWGMVFQGRCLRLLDRPLEALSRLDSAVRRDPCLSEARRERARISGMLGRTENALADLDMAVGWNPDDPALRLLRAETSAGTASRAGQAIEDLSLAAKSFPKLKRVFELRSELYLGEGDVPAAVKDLERLEVLSPQSWELPARKGGILRSAHMYADAARAWGRAALLKGSGDPRLEWNRLETLRLAGEFEECLAGLGRFSGAPKWRAPALLLKGEAELGLMRLDEAILTAGKVLEADPGSSLEAKTLRARAYILRGATTHGKGEQNEDFVKAYFDIQAYYPKALRNEEMDPDDRARVFAVMGLYQMTAEGNNDRAVQDFKRAVECRPDERDAHRYLGAVAAKRPGTLPPGEGEAHLERALELGHPDRAGIHLDRGRLMAASGRAEEAAVEFRKVLDSDPENKEARRALTALEKE